MRAGAPAPRTPRARSRRCVLAALSVAAVLAASCVARPLEIPRETPPILPAPAAPRVALVLGGGGARGFAHVGVIHVLEQEKIPVDLVVGTSVGSLIGALYADLGDAFELEAIAWQIQRDDLFDFSLIGIGRGPFAGEALEEFVRKHVRAGVIEQLRRPFVAVATDLVTGEQVVLDRGPLAAAIRASSAIPGVYRPVALGGRTLVDGGVVNPIPVSVARDRAAAVVIAVDVSRELPVEEPGNVYSIWMRSLSILTREMARLKGRGADVLIEPKVGDTSPFDFSKKKELMAAGIAAAREAIPAIRAALASKLSPVASTP